MSKFIRTALAAFAAVGVIAASGVVGVASTAAADTATTRSQESIETRLPVVDGWTVAHVQYTGGSTWGLTEHDIMCDELANRANEQTAAGFKDLYDGNMAGAAEKFGGAVETIRGGESKGCEFE